MLGLLISNREQREIEYLIKCELEELLFELKDQYIDSEMKKSIQERYELLFQLLLRVASKEDCLPYVPPHFKNK